MKMEKILTKKNLKRYFEEMSKISGVTFTPCDPVSCPIGRYLNESVGLDDAEVFDAEGSYIVGGRVRMFTLPQWATRFVKQVDTHDDYITPVAAAKILSEV